MHPFETSWNIRLGISYGTDGFKANLNAGVGHRWNNAAAAYGIGMTYHSNFYNTKKRGWELRTSFMGGFNDGVTESYLGTNQWIGFGQMREFNQRTGILLYRHRNGLRFSYENDGTPFNNWAGDGGDRYRTAAASIGFRDFSVNMNLFTGYRNLEQEKKDATGSDGKVDSNKLKGLPEGRGKYGEYYHHGFAYEEGIRYRYGGLTLNYREFSAGFDSEWIRHAFQNVFAHHILKPQRQFEMLSSDWRFIQQTGRVQTQFTTW